VTRVSPLGFSGKTVAATCAKTSPWTPGLSAPGCAVATSEQIPASDMACGALDDLAVATSGHIPAKLVLTRLEGLATCTPAGRALELIALGSVPSFHEAKAGPLCTEQKSDAGPSMPTGEPAPTGSPPSTEEAEPPPPSSGSSGDGCRTTLAILDACSRSDSSGGEGCDCDSTSSSSGDSCSSGSSGGSSGCDCKGASDVADDGCRTARVRPRIRVSAAAYLLIIAAAIARRWGRKSRTIGDERRCPETISSSAPTRE
jgi:hypothetical protein